MPNRELLSAESIAPCFFLNKMKVGGYLVVNVIVAIGIVSVRLPVAVVVGIVIDGHSRSVDGEDIVTDIFYFP